MKLFVEKDIKPDQKMSQQLISPVPRLMIKFSSLLHDTNYQLMKLPGNIAMSYMA